MPDDYLNQRVDSEIVIGLVGAVGTDLSVVSNELRSWLGEAGYAVEEVHISRELLSNNANVPHDAGEGDRIRQLMDAGDRLRQESGENSILALGAAAIIRNRRERSDGKTQPKPRTAFLVTSLKHPEEVTQFRRIYPGAFYLVGVHADENRRRQFLTEVKSVDKEVAKELIARDANSKISHGQKVSATFHQADFFVRIDGNSDQLHANINRILELLFANPHLTPTFDEYAMFMAFAASLQSADLSRQVGAVVTRGEEVLATGANDCPKSGGGHYWPYYDEAQRKVRDHEGGRDSVIGYDANRKELGNLADEIARFLAESSGVSIDDIGALADALKKSPLRDLTEFGRVVHAEMAAITACARLGFSTVGTTLFCTTFPCHNCAKHIVSSGVSRVVYVEPYEKSKAQELHADAINVDFADSSDPQGRVVFEPFVGVGPRRFFDLFSMSLGWGAKVVRKNSDGTAIQWRRAGANLKVQMLPASYLELETAAALNFRDLQPRMVSDEGQSNDENKQ